MKVVKSSALLTGRFYPPVNIRGTHFCQRLRRPQGHSANRKKKSMKNSNNAIGIQTRDPPSCSAVPQLNIDKDNFRLIKALTWFKCVDSGLLPRSYEFISGPIPVSFAGDKGTFLQFYSTCSQLGLPCQCHQTTAPTHLRPNAINIGRQVDETWKPSKNKMLFVMSESIGQKSNAKFFPPI